MKYILFLLACICIFQLPAQKRISIFGGAGLNFSIVGGFHAQPVGIFSKIGDLKIWQNLYAGVDFQFGSSRFSTAPEVYLLQKGFKLNVPKPERHTVGFANFVSWGLACPLVLNLQNDAGTGFRFSAGGFADLTANSYFSNTDELVEKVPTRERFDFGWLAGAHFMFEEYVEVRVRYQNGLQRVDFEIPPQSQSAIRGYWTGEIASWLLSFHYNFSVRE